MHATKQPGTATVAHVQQATNAYISTSLEVLLLWVGCDALHNSLQLVLKLSTHEE
jgi:hypothetical protein